MEKKNSQDERERQPSHAWKYAASLPRKRQQRILLDPDISLGIRTNIWCYRSANVTRSKFSGYWSQSGAVGTRNASYHFFEKQNSRSWFPSVWCQSQHYDGRIPSQGHQIGWCDKIREGVNQQRSIHLSVQKVWRQFDFIQRKHDEWIQTGLSSRHTADDRRWR